MVRHPVLRATLGCGRHRQLLHLHRRHRTAGPVRHPRATPDAGVGSASHLVWGDGVTAGRGDRAPDVTPLVAWGRVSRSARCCFRRPSPSRALDRRAAVGARRGTGRRRVLGRDRGLFFDINLNSLQTAVIHDGIRAGSPARTAPSTTGCARSAPPSAVCSPPPWDFARHSWWPPPVARCQCSGCSAPPYRRSATWPRRPSTKILNRPTDRAVAFSPGSGLCW